MIIIILVAALILRLWNLNQSLWLDEAAQAIESSQTIPVIWGHMQADFHPPLFNLLLHFWQSLGTSEWTMRVLPLLFGLGSIMVIYFLTKELFGKKVAQIAALLLAINPFHIYYSQELRSYIIDSFFAVLATYFFWRSLHDSRKWWLGFCLSMAAFFYTSYFAVFLLLAFGLFLLSQKDYRFAIRNFLIAAVVAGMLFLPWVPQIPLQLQISQGFAADLPGWKDAVASPVYKVIPLTLVKFIIGQIDFRPILQYILISAGLLALYGWVIFVGRDFKSKAWVFILSLFTLGLVLPVIFSIFLQIASPKRLILTLPLLIILLSFGIDKLKGKIYAAFLIVFVLMNLIFLTIYQTNPIFQREDWRSAVRDVEEKSDSMTAVVFKFSAPFAPYTWYSHKGLPVYGISNTLAFNQEFLASELPKKLEDKRKVFVFQYLEELTDKDKQTEKLLGKLGYGKKQTLDYPGVGFVYEYIR